jgi:hypothetical protein
MRYVSRWIGVTSLSLLLSACQEPSHPVAPSMGAQASTAPAATGSRYRRLASGVPGTRLSVA